MRTKRLFMFALSVWIALSGAVVAQEVAKPDHEGSSLSNVLTDLLNGGKKKSALIATPNRRVPFGREEMQLSFAPLVKDTAAAVANVYASQQVKVRSPFDDDPFFEQFFGHSSPRQRSSLGSGVLVDPVGFIVTNNHVVQDSDQVKVALSDGREFTSRVLLKDETLDLAVLKIDSDKPFPTITIGDSDALQVGDLVLAIGNPFGVGQTTTSGIVSALARTHIGVSDSGFFIQTDAAINPGNSGGALINMGSQLVGINTAIFSRSGGSIGIGFAIPSNMVRAFTEAAKSGAEFFEKPYIGASFEPVTAQIAESLGMDHPSGAMISSVDDNGPSAKAGLKPGNVILSFNEAAVEHVEALDYRLATQPIGGKAILLVLSNGKERRVEVALERTPDSTSTNDVLLRGRSPFAGAKIAELSPRLAHHLRVATDTKGVAIIDIDNDSPAASFGFQNGDIVREVNGEIIDSTAKLKQLVEEDTRWWRFTVERDGRLIRQMLRY